MAFGGEQHIVYSNDPDYIKYGNNDFSRAKSFALDRFIEVELDESCDTHLQIVAEKQSAKRDLISGELYRSGAVFSKFSLFFSNSVGVVERFKAALFTNESTVIKATTSGGSSGVSLSIPFIGGVGSGDSSSTTNLTAQRLVSRDVLDEAVTNAVSGTSAYCTGTSDACQTAMKSLVDSIVADGFGKASLVRGEDGQYRVVKDQIAYFTITNSAINSDLDSKFKSIVDKKDVTTAGDGKSTATTDDSLKTETAIDVAGAIGATNIPVAVTGDLVVVSEETIDAIVRVELTNRIPVEGVQRFFFPFLYPALGYRDDVITSVAEDLVYRQAIYEEEQLRQSCVSDVFKQERKAAGSKTIRGSKPRTWTDPVIAVARPGFYISTWVSVVTSSHNGQSAPVGSPLPHDENVTVGGKDHMFQSIAYQYYCKRGNSGPKKRECTASGYIQYVEQPVKCARFLIDKYDEAKLAAGTE